MFPNLQNPISGIWVRNQADALSEYCTITVVSPTPYFPSIPIPIFKRFYRYGKIPKQEKTSKMMVYHPRYLWFPYASSTLFITPSYLLSLLIFSRQLHQEFKRTSLIHAHAILPDGFCAVILGAIFKKPVIITTHGSDLRDKYKKMIEGALIRFSARKATVVISPHPELSEILKRLHCKRTEICNGVDSNFFNREFTKEAKSVQQLLKTNNKKVVLFVAFLTEFKDPLTLVESYPFVASKRKDVIFLMAGDGPLRQAVQNRINSLKLGDSVILLGLRRDINTILKISDVFVALSPYENIWSVSLCEAMMAGVPCIVTQSGTAHKLSLSLSSMMYFIPPKNPERLGQAILDILDHPERSHDVSLKASNYTHNNFDLDQTTDNLIRLYKKVIEERSR